MQNPGSLVSLGLVDIIKFRPKKYKDRA